MIFVGVMAILAVLGFCVSIKFLIESGHKPVDIVKKSLDLITITVPPILPSAMTIGTVYSIQRLKKS